MKTFEDLMRLITQEIKMNDGKVLKYKFHLDTRYQWLSMYEEAYENGKEHKKEIISHLSVKTFAELQCAYWTVWTNGRSRNTKSPENDLIFEG